MLSIGRSKRATGDGLIDLLLDCHRRIRRFLMLAELLAAAKSSSDEDVRNTAEQVHRYFAEALPLHIADEDHSILPRLVQAKPELAAALDQMHSEHHSHAAHIDALVEICAILKDDPGRLADHQGRLTGITEVLVRELHAHLAHEEEVIFPALAELPADQQDTIVAELRARRSVPA